MSLEQAKLQKQSPEIFISSHFLQVWKTGQRSDRRSSGWWLRDGKNEMMLLFCIFTAVKKTRKIVAFIWTELTVAHDQGKSFWLIGSIHNNFATVRENEHFSKFNYNWSFIAFIFSLLNFLFYPTGMNQTKVRCFCNTNALWWPAALTG